MTNEDMVQNGLEARDLLNNPAFARAFEAVQTHFMMKIVNSDPVNGREERESAYRNYHALRLAVEALRAEYASGIEAEERLNNDFPEEDY